MKIACSIAGYEGSPVTLLSLLDESTGILVVSKVRNKGFTQERLPGYAFVTNLHVDDRDSLFDEAVIGDAVEEFRRRLSQKTVIVESEVALYNPDNKIELDRVDTNGRRYRIDPTVNNGQMAVLATVHFATKQGVIRTGIDAMSDLAEFYKVTTI